MSLAASFFWYVKRAADAASVSAARTVYMVIRICPRLPRIAPQNTYRDLLCGKSIGQLIACQRSLEGLSTPPSLWPGRELRKSHDAVKAHRCMRLLSALTAGFRFALYRASWRSPLMWLPFTEGVPIECIFSCKVRSDFSGCNNSVVTSISLSGKWMLFYCLADCIFP